MQRGGERFQRMYTDSIVESQYEKSLKVQGIIDVWSGGGERGKVMNMEISSDNKLLYYCSKRYKTFQYWFDSVHENGSGMEFDSLYFERANAVQAIQSEFDYMLYCTGLAPSGRRRQLPFIPMLFYQKLSAIHERVIKGQELLFRVNFLAANQEYLFDLIGESSVEVREINHLRRPELCEISFCGAEYVTPHSLYQLFSAIRSTLNKKNKLQTNSYYLIYAEIISKQRKDEKRRILMLDGTKDSKCRERNWDGGIIHVLNKCLLGLHRKIENQQRESYTPFRDCKITRVLKPFLIYNSRVDAIGFIGREEDEVNFVTLNLIANLQRVRVPIKIENKLRVKEKSQRDGRRYLVMKDRQELNPQLLIDRQQWNENKYDEQMEGSGEKMKYKSCQKLNLFDQVRRNAEAEIIVMRKLNEVREKMRLMLKKKQINRIKKEENESQLLNNLQQKQYQFKKNEQKLYTQQYENINKNRMQTINKQQYKLNKLKLLKQYYTIALNNQNVQIDQFIKNKSIIKNFYENHINSIENHINKNIYMERQGNILYHDLKQKKNQRFITVDKNYKHNLPNINNSKRVSFIKDTVRRGRAQYSKFLKKNVDMYQLYRVKNSI